VSGAGAADSPGAPGLPGAVGAEIFTDAWAAGWGREINASDPFRVAGVRWEDALVLVMEPDPAFGVATRRAVCVELSRGECRAARAATAEDLDGAPYVLSAQAAIWKEVLYGQMEPVQAVMLGLINLSRGSLVSLAPQVTAAQHLLAAASRVPTVFPAGWE
jgi:putative sterol carrier protein